MKRLAARRQAMLRFALSLLLPGLLACGPATAQTKAPHDFQTYRPSLPATRISVSEAPDIDGDISDPVWQKAPALDEFYQLEPREGAPASERTVVHVLYDDKNIYIAFMAFDDEPQ